MTSPSEFPDVAFVFLGAAAPFVTGGGGAGTGVGGS